MKVTSGEGRGGGFFSRFVVTVLILAVIALVTVFFAARSEWAMSFMTENLSKRLGMDVKIGSMRIAFPYVLLMSDVASDGFGADAPGFRAANIRIGLTFGRRLKVSIYKPELVLARGEDGQWIPRGVGRMGELLEGSVADVSTLTDAFRERMRLRVDRGSIVWLGDGQEAARAEGISFRVDPARIPGHGLYYCSLSVYGASGAGIEAVHDVEREWLTSSSRKYIEIHRGGRPESAANTGFWRPVANVAEPDVSVGEEGLGDEG